MTALLNDSHFWVLISFSIFAVVAFKKGRGPILGMLDGRTARIRADLDEAAHLRAEAQALLAESQRKHRDAVQTAQKIVDSARETAVRMQKDAATRLDESLRRREAQFTDRIARAEAAAVHEIRTQAADLAARAAESLLAEALPKTGAKLVDEAIRAIPARLN